VADTRVFELRTYQALPGRLDALQARFRDHTMGLFARHGIEVVVFCRPTDGERARDTLTYLLAFPDRAAAEASWTKFRADPEWIAAKAASEADGDIVDHMDSTFLAPTDYSPLS